MVTVTGFMISSIFIDVITLLVAKSAGYLKGSHSYFFRVLERIYFSENSISEYFRKIHRKMISFNLIYRYTRPFMPPGKMFIYETDPEIFVVIPAYNEEENISGCIRSAFEQTKKPSKVIVIDDCSNDGTAAVCEEAKRMYRDLIVIRQEENKGKAYNMSYVINNFYLGDITLVLDADTYLSRNYIEEIIKPFKNERIVVSTGISTPFEMPNRFGKIIFRGSIFQYLFFCFRKEAQAMRNAVSVVCGDSSAYRTSFLKKMGGFPEGTQTEDMDLTWKALEMGHEISFQRKALANSREPSTLKGHWKQMLRWYAGGFQCIYVHGRNLFRAKSLLITSLIPVYFDVIVYSPIFLLGPILFFFFPLFIAWFYILDLLFTMIALIYVDWRMLANLPEIYAVKFIWSCVWLFAAFKTTFEYLGGKRSWASKWSRDGLYAQPNKIKLQPDLKFN